MQASAQRASRSTSAIDSAWSSVSLSGIEIRLIVEFAHRLIEDDAPRGGTICCPGSSSPDFNDFASNDYRTLRILVLLLVVTRSAPAEIYHHPGTAARRVKNRISIPDRLTLDQAESIALAAGAECSCG